MSTQPSDESVPLHHQTLRAGGNASVPSCDYGGAGFALAFAFDEGAAPCRNASCRARRASSSFALWFLTYSLSGNQGEATLGRPGGSIG